MMKWLLLSVRWSTVLLLSYLMVSFWLGSRWSERLWSWLNDQTAGGKNPGLASDVELVLVLVVALALAVLAVSLIARLWQAVVGRLRDGVG